MDIKAVIELIQQELAGMWRYRWIAVAFAWGICVLGALGIYMLPNQYVSTARVFVDTENVLRPLLRGLSVEGDVMNDVTVMTRAMLSRPNLEQVARKTDIDIKARTPEDYEKLLISLEERIQIQGNREHIYTISFQSADRDESLSVVKELLNSFIEDTVGSGKEESAQAEETLRREIKDYERRLVQAEENLKEFKQRNVGLMPGDRGDYYAQLREALGSLESAKQRVGIVRQRREALKRQLVGEEPVFGIMASGADGFGTGAGTSVDAEIAQLESMRAELLINYTEKYPRVVQINARLEELYEQQREELANAPLTAPINPQTNSLDLNPVYQNIKIQLSNVEVELAEATAELRDREEEVERLRNLVDVVPEVEAELNRLNRDYDVVKGRYETMLGRWEDLQTSQRVSTESDSVEFRVIDPPYAPLKPTGPPRGLMLVALIVVGFGAGGALAFLISYARPVYSGVKGLQTLGLPVMGAVSRVKTSTENRRVTRDRYLFVLACSGLVAVNVLFIGFAGQASLALRNLVGSG